MARRLVEDVGPHLHAGSLQRWRAWTRSRAGAERVGPVTVGWAIAADPLRLDVSHPPPTVPTAGPPAPAAEPPERYPVRLAVTGTPNGGGRWWFACPGCERRCDLLYLAPPAPRLACRVCHGLAYRSQRTRQPVRRRRTRTTVWFETVTTVWRSRIR